MTTSARLFGALLTVLAVLPQAALAADPVTLSISIKDHKFDPAELKAPADTPITLTVNNLDPTPEEFEGDELGVEKIIAGKSSAVVRIKPLKKGTYPFVGEFNEASAKGVLIVE